MELVARKKTHSVLSEIDDLLDDTRSLAAKISFDNLFPVDEDDMEYGEFWTIHGRAPYPGEGGFTGSLNRQRIMQHCNEDCCRITLWDGTRIVNYHEVKTSEMFKPILEPSNSSYADEDEDGNVFWHENWNENDLDALRYSLEFFGGPEFIYIETAYAGEAVSLNDDCTSLLETVEEGMSNE